MVVIKPGNAKKPWSCDVTCPECAAELQVDEADLWRFVNCEIYMPYASSVKLF